jgi:ATP phosphoribosyltransferase regulatory subunit
MTEPANNNGRTRANALVELYERAGYLRLDPPILQPADVFLELAGEELRRRLFLTTDNKGRELCLRPDLTIPVCREHLKRASGKRAAAYCYLGPVFRDRGDRLSEFLQAGVESLGRADREAADAEILNLAIESIAQYGGAKPKIRMGDVGLFGALVEALDLAPVWRRRLMKDFNRSGTLADDLATLKHAPSAAAEHAGVLAALAGSDPAAARALVADLISIAGIKAVGGRTVEEIAERFLEQAALGATTGLRAETTAVLERYLTIEGDPDEASASLRALSADAALDLTRALDSFERRTGFLAAGGVDITQIRFATAFGRPLDYYSGMVFELYDAGNRVEGPLVAGGRYDRLMSLIGAPDPVPAVGFAAWIDRLDLAGAKP